MHSQIVVPFLTALAIAAEPVPAASPSSPYQACAASLDGQLPTATPPGFQFSGNVQRYFVAAEEVEWDYAPTGWDNWLGLPIAESPRAKQSITYGTKCLKALYRGYTDSHFNQLTEQPPWQGSQGPTLRTEVGDMLEIMFVNKLSKNYATMHSMGLSYNKRNEGGDYPPNPRPGQNSTIPLGDAVPPVERGVGPGECVVYKWLANPAAGPNNNESARAHSYHSYVDMRTDTNAGLMGPSIVYAAGQMNATMQRNKEFPVLYNVYMEQASFLSGDNAEKLVGNKSMSMYGSVTQNLGSGNYSIWHPQVVNLASSDQFANAPKFYALNGYIFANNPPFTMDEGDNVIWYAYAFGGASHVFHLHGNGFRYHGEDRFAVSLNDGVSATLFMQATDRGLWQLICHVNNHHQDGMVANYLVRPSE